MLQLKNIDKSFGTKQVAQNISLSVEGGGVLAVLGKSGCGKSTLLKIIARLTPADGGEVWLNGRDITLMPSEKRNISLMFQDYALFPHLNAWQNAAFGLKMRKVPRKEAEQRARQALDEVGLGGEAERSVDSLSATCATKPSAGYAGRTFPPYWLPTTPKKPSPSPTASP